MEYRQLGTEGPEVSVIGLGAWPLGGGMGRVDEQTAIDTIRAAIDAGIGLVDTAESYRSSEATVGKALKDGYRERCFLATKVSRDYSAAGIAAAIDNSLRLLQVDYVDLYQIHGWNPASPVEESMEAMAELQEQGKVRYIGVSNFNADQMARAARAAPFQSNQPRYGMLHRSIEAEDIPYCEEHGVGILAHSPLGKGLLTGRYRPGHQFAEGDERRSFDSFQGEVFERYVETTDRLQELAGDKGLSIVQLAIAWVLRQEAVTCALVGAKSPDQVEEHIGAAGVDFTDDELARIDLILQDLEGSDRS